MGDKILFTNIENTRGFFVIHDQYLRLVDFAVPSSELLGKIYVGRVSNVVANLNAAFVEYEKGKQGFLSLSARDNQNLNAIKNEMRLPVQIKTAPLKTKDAVLSSELSLPGVYCVVTNTPGGIHFSKKISIDKKKEIKDYIKGLLHPDMSCIIRSNAMALSTDDFSLLKKELEELQDKLCEIMNKCTSRAFYTCVYDKSEFLLSNLSKVNFLYVDEIITDSPYEFDFLKERLPKDLQEKLTLYTDDFPLTALYEIKAKLSHAIQRTVWLKSGGYLVIDYTEALTVIDVNSGKNIKKLSKNELTKITNEEAAQIVPYIMSVNNMSGIILVDFINTNSKADEEALISILKHNLYLDPNKADFCDVTKLGLVELTRQKKDILTIVKMKEAGIYEIIKN